MSGESEHGSPWKCRSKPGSATLGHTNELLVLTIEVSRVKNDERMLRVRSKQYESLGEYLVLCVQGTVFGQFTQRDALLGNRVPFKVLPERS